MVFSPDGTWLASATSTEGAVKVWDMKIGKLIRSFGQGDGISQLAVSPKGAWVATAGAGPDTLVRVWDAKTGKTHKVIRLPEPVTCLAFSPDEAHLAVGSRDATVTLCEVSTGQKAATYRGHEAYVCAVAF